MFKLLYFAICIAGMIGFFYLCRFLIYSVSLEFGMGVATGVGMTIVLMWLAERVQAR